MYLPPFPPFPTFLAPTQQWVRLRLKQAGLPPPDKVFLVSAAKGTGVKDMVQVGAGDDGRRGQRAQVTAGAGHGMTYSGRSNSAALLHAVVPLAVQPRSGLMTPQPPRLIPTLPHPPPAAPSLPPSLPPSPPAHPPPVQDVRQALGYRGDLWVVGAQNAGKSSLIAAMKRLAGTAGEAGRGGGGGGAGGGGQGGAREGAERQRGEGAKRGRRRGRAGRIQVWEWAGSHFDSRP